MYVYISVSVSVFFTQMGSSYAYRFLFFFHLLYFGDLSFWTYGSTILFRMAGWCSKEWMDVLYISPSLMDF